jgi:hypothetical protein
MFEKVEFGLNAASYIRLQLSTWDVLWQRLCTLPLEAGRVHAFLPPTTTPWDLLHFAWHLNSRKDLEDGSVDYEYQVQEHAFVVERINQAPNRVGVFLGEVIPDKSRGPRAIPGAIATQTTEVFSNRYDDKIRAMTNIYYMLRPGPAEPMITAYNCFERMPFIGMITSLPDEAPEVFQGQELTDEFLDKLAANTTAILVSAFGNDATLILTPS